MSHFYIFICNIFITYNLVPSFDKFIDISSIQKRSEMILDDISTAHLAIADFHSFSCDDTDFFLFCSDDEEDTIIEMFLSDTIFLENFHPDIDEFISLSMRYDDCHDLLSSSVFMQGKHLIQKAYFISGDDLTVVVYI